jgi:hypothetical protein
LTSTNIPEPSTAPARLKFRSCLDSGNGSINRCAAALYIAKHATISTLQRRCPQVTFVLKPLRGHPVTKCSQSESMVRQFICRECSGTVESNRTAEHRAAAALFASGKLLTEDRGAFAGVNRRPAKLRGRSQRMRHHPCLSLAFRRRHSQPAALLRLTRDLEIKEKS